MYYGSLITLVVASMVAVAAEPTSGVPIGQRPGPYSFLIATGKERGQQTCFICETADKPAVIVFARKVNPEVGKLFTKLDSWISNAPKESIRGWATILGEKTIALDDLATLSQNLGLKQLPLGVFDDPVGPPTYRLKADVDLTILVFTKQKVTARYNWQANNITESDLLQLQQSIQQVQTKP